MPSSNPRQMPHYVSIMHPLVVQDMRENNTVVTAWSYSDINRLYNAEVGEWGGVRFCSSNLVPTFTGNANTGFTDRDGARFEDPFHGAAGKGTADENARARFHGVHSTV